VKKFLEALGLHENRKMTNNEQTKKSLGMK